MLTMKHCVEAVRKVYDLALSTFSSVFLYLYIVNKVLLQKGLQFDSSHTPLSVFLYFYIVL